MIQCENDGSGTGFRGLPLDARGLSAWEIVFLRASLTTVMLFAIAAVCDRAKLRVRLRDLWCFAGTAVFADICDLPDSIS